MLVLTRNPGESVILDGGIKITVIEFQNGNPNQIKIGIEAPDDVNIVREELIHTVYANYGHD